MGRAPRRFASSRFGFRADAPASGSSPRRHRGGDPGFLVRGTAQDPAVGLRSRPGLCGLPRGPNRHSRHCADDLPQVARGHFFGAGLGFALAHWRVLLGTTAVWGSSPGAATAVVLMADAFGGDMRLVAVMQYLRVVCVGLVASVVARAWSASGGAASVAIDWFPPLAPGPLFATVALAWSAQSSASSRGSRLARCWRRFSSAPRFRRATFL
jgi:Transition state regulatory protein AbrB